MHNKRAEVYQRSSTFCKQQMDPSGNIFAKTAAKQAWCPHAESSLPNPFAPFAPFPIHEHDLKTVLRTHTSEFWACPRCQAQCQSLFLQCDECELQVCFNCVAHYKARNTRTPGSDSRKATLAPLAWTRSTLLGKVWKRFSHDEMENGWKPLSPA